MRLSKDGTQVRYNDFLTLGNIPPEAHQYRLGNRSALAWLVDQYRVTVDRRSGLRNDPNRADDPEYILRLIGQVVTVSVETVRLVAALPGTFVGATVGGGGGKARRARKEGGWCDGRGGRGRGKGGGAHPGVGGRRPRPYPAPAHHPAHWTNRPVGVGPARNPSRTHALAPRAASPACCRRGSKEAGGMRRHPPAHWTDRPVGVGPARNPSRTHTLVPRAASPAVPRTLHRSIASALDRRWRADTQVCPYRRGVIAGRGWQIERKGEPVSDTPPTKRGGDQCLRSGFRAACPQCLALRRGRANRRSVRPIPHGLPLPVTPRQARDAMPGDWQWFAHLEGLPKSCHPQCVQQPGELPHPIFRRSVTVVTGYPFHRWG